MTTPTPGFWTDQATDAKIWRTHHANAADSQIDAAHTHRSLDVAQRSGRSFNPVVETREIDLRSSSSSRQEEFLARIGAGNPFRQLFDYMPGVLFFAKDARSRLMCGCPALVKRLGLGSERDLIGRTDDDFFPPHVVARFRADDALVLQTGKPLVDRIELWYSEHHLLDWFVTTKVPLFDAQGHAVGLIGIIRSYEGKRKAMAVCSNLTRVIDYLYAHLGGSLALAALAQAGSLSERQLQRKVRAVFQMSVHQFIIKTRVQHAAKAMLETDRSLAAIAAEFGFCDQSAFTRQFRLHTGLSPLKFRQRFWK